MMTDSADILNGLCNDIALKFVIQFIRCTGIHEILPYKQSQFITQIKEEVLRIITAAPDADTVVVRPYRIP